MLIGKDLTVIVNLLCVQAVPGMEAEMICAPAHEVHCVPFIVLWQKVQVRRMEMIPTTNIKSK